MDGVVPPTPPCHRLVLTHVTRMYADVFNSDDDTRHRPDPIAYLRGFDSSEAVKPYKAALLEACELKPGAAVLNVGCGLGSQTLSLVNAVNSDASNPILDPTPASAVPITTAATPPTSISPQPKLTAAAAAAAGHVLCVDISADAMAASRERAAADGIPMELASFEVADAYTLPYAANTFDVVLEDRVLQ